MNNLVEEAIRRETLRQETLHQDALRRLLVEKSGADGANTVRDPSFPGFLTASKPSQTSAPSDPREVSHYNSVQDTSNDANVANLLVGGMRHEDIEVLRNKMYGQTQRDHQNQQESVASLLHQYRLQEQLYQQQELLSILSRQYRLPTEVQLPGGLTIDSLALRAALFQQAKEKEALHNGSWPLRTPQLQESKPQQMHLGADQADSWALRMSQLQQKQSGDLQNSQLAQLRQAQLQQAQLQQAQLQKAHSDSLTSDALAMRAAQMQQAQLQKAQSNSLQSEALAMRAAQLQQAQFQQVQLQQVQLQQAQFQQAQLQAQFQQAQLHQIEKGTFQQDALSLRAAQLQKAQLQQAQPFHDLSMSAQSRTSRSTAGPQVLGGDPGSRGSDVSLPQPKPALGGPVQTPSLNSKPTKLVVTKEPQKVAGSSPSVASGEPPKAKKLPPKKQLLKKKDVPHKKSSSNKHSALGGRILE